MKFTSLSSYKDVCMPIKQTQQQRTNIAHLVQ
uniref:Uncharacterized protein n=1 Tax=Rhizophora mucronata TaxID=61149 RepID=A0A2P2QMK7_RHIMU